MEERRPSKPIVLGVPGSIPGSVLYFFAIAIVAIVEFTSYFLFLQVEFLFTDKTGTLTENEMNFRRCSVEGVKYEEINRKLHLAVSATNSTATQVTNLSVSVLGMRPHCQSKYRI